MQHLPEAGLRVAPVLKEFIETEALPGTGLDAAAFWSGLAGLVAGFAPRNRALLEQPRRAAGADRRLAPGQPGAADRPGRLHRRSCARSATWRPSRPHFAVGTANVDPEIASIAGPQLVVPVNNARYALNAGNARWGSLYDALYGTDAIGDEDGMARGGGYNPVRGARGGGARPRVPGRRRAAGHASHADVAAYAVQRRRGWRRRCGSGAHTGLADPAQARRLPGRPGRAHRRAADATTACTSSCRSTAAIRSAATDPAGIADVVLESAITTIMDCEDSVAAVDAEDKVARLPQLARPDEGRPDAPTFEKGGRDAASAGSTRTAATPRRTAAPLTLPGRSLMLVRNVGHHMYTDAVLDADGSDDPGDHPRCRRHLADRAARPARRGAAAQFAAPARSTSSSRRCTARTRSPTPPTCSPRVEDLLGLARNTLKMGIMDEERRTTVNLAACIHAARERVVFINTGFLDRTGDEIHTSMEAGAMVRKNDMRAATWIGAYENNNVDVGLACGLRGRAQIGKGMWAAPDRMADMLAQKIGHPRAGANTAWVPSPTAATLHALHYHQVDVAARAGGTRRAARRRRWPTSCTCRWPTGRTGRPRKCSRNSTTTARASWATWCAGSTRAWAARRCRTSTMSA